MRSEEARPEGMAIIYATGTHFLPRTFRILTQHSARDCPTARHRAPFPENKIFREKLA